MTTEEYCLRRARRSDIAAIHALQRASLGALGRAFYGAEEIDAALAHVPLTGCELIDEGHFFVVEEAGCGLVATGGWSRVRPAYAAFQATGSPQSAPGEATVRHVFVHPDQARRGFGTCIMRCVEQDASAAGVARLVMAATLAGRPLYRRLGYAETGDASVFLPGGVRFPLVGMEKSLAQAAPLAA